MNEVDIAALVVWLGERGYKLVNINSNAPTPGVSQMTEVNGNMVKTQTTSFIVSKETVFAPQ